jgi:hypothetical protein
VKLAIHLHLLPTSRLAELQLHSPSCSCVTLNEAGSVVYRTGQDRTGQDRTGQDRTGQVLEGGSLSVSRSLSRAHGHLKSCPVTLSKPSGYYVVASGLSENLTILLK